MTVDNKSYRIMVKFDIELKNTYGASTHLSEIINGLKKDGHEVTLLCPKRRYNKNLTYESILVPGIGASSAIRSVTEQFMFLFYIMYHIIRLKPHFVYMRNSTWNISGVFAVKILSKPCILEVNDFFPEELDHLKAGYLTKKLNDIMEKINYMLCDRIITVNAEIKEKLSVRYNIPRDKIDVVTNKVNTDLFRPCDKHSMLELLGLDRNYRYMCFVGKVVSWQGLENLVKASKFVRCGDVKYLIVGDGPAKEELILLAKQLDVYDKFIFTGLVPYEDVPFYIGASDICVAPFAKGRLASPLKIFEYMACERPFISSRIDGLDDIIKRSNGGIIVTPENPMELADAMDNLLSDNDKMIEMGVNGRNYILDTSYTWDKNIEVILDISKKCL